MPWWAECKPTSPKPIACAGGSFGNDYTTASTRSGRAYDFSDTRSDLSFDARDGYKVRQAKLTADNYLLALRASGAIPVYMQAVRLPEDPSHKYHDGGMLDYHPVPGTFWPETDGLILYPHFYDHFKMRWFDKFYPWRKALDDYLIRSL